MYTLKFKISILFCFGCLLVLAQTGSLSGVIIDKKTSETLIGASVFIQGTTLGAGANLDGAYEIKNIPAGIYDVRISYVSYNTQVIKGVEIKAGKATVVNGALETGTELKEVEITATANRQSTMTLMNTLRNTSSMSVGISQETIKRSPDRNVGEVLKRVSGLSVQDNKFVIVRGLADRYNFALINGMPLISAEPDKKTISFDIFPSNVIDNIVVTKTASPDLPGEFAGGIIQINTREIPDESFLSVTIGGGTNSQTTFNAYKYYDRGSNARLGLTNKTRFLPKEIGQNNASFNGPSADPYNPIALENSNKFNNIWRLNNKSNAPINSNFQIAGSKKLKFKNDGSLGVLISLTHRVNQRLIIAENNLFDARDREDINAKQIYQFKLTDEQFVLSSFIGGIVNFNFDINKYNKIFIKNLMGVNNNDLTLTREGFNYGVGNFLKQNGSIYNTTNNFTTQAQFEHIGKRFNDKFNFGYSFTNLYKLTPDLKFVLYNSFPTEFDENNNPIDNGEYNIDLGGYSGSSGSRIYVGLNENLNVYSADYKFPIVKDKHFIKIGILKTNKNRSYYARFFGYAKRFSGIDATLDSLTRVINVSQELIFNDNNVDSNKFSLREVTTPSDRYTGTSENNSIYVMLDNQITKKLRLIWGLRYEKFSQKILGFNSTLTDGQPVERNSENSTIDFLPSANLIYNLTEKHVFRLAASRTVARAEFREVAPNSFYDFTTYSIFNGNDTLKSATIENYDFKYEFYPAPGQIFSASLFYKQFYNPIEQVFAQANNSYFYVNQSLGAFDFGAEVEFRIKVSSIPGLKSLNYLDNFTFGANYAYIKSEIDQSNLVDVYNKKRPLQGQSPYILNASFDYRNSKAGLGFTILFNRIGDRISSIGNSNAPDVIERSRSILDFQILKTLFEEKCEIRFSCNDFINQSAIFYQDINFNKKYDNAETDQLIQSYRYGINYSLSVSYRF